MEEFLENIYKEKQLYALTNFFKLILIGKLTRKDYNSFSLVEGHDKVARLIRDIEEGYIDLFAEETPKHVSTLYYEMMNLYQDLQSVKVSRSTHLLNALENVSQIASYDRFFIEEDAVAVLTLIGCLPIEIREEFRLTQVIFLSYEKQKVKKKGNQL